MKDILIVIDMQNDFVDGSLGSEEAKKIVKPLSEYISSFAGDVIYTRDTHYEDYLDTQEGKFLPVAHCIYETDGWQLCPELNELAIKKESKIYNKITFGSTELSKDLVKINDTEGINSIILTGVCTDICVVSNALTIKANLPEIPIYVKENLTAATSPLMQEKTIDVLKSCQIQII